MNTTGGSGNDDFQDMTKEELIDAIELLQKELDECHDEIQELNTKNMKLQRKLKKYGGDEDDGDDAQDMDNVLNNVALETENEELREKLSKLTAEMTSLKEKNAEYKASIAVYKSEKTEADVDIRNLRKKIDDLEKTLSENEESMRANLRKSQDISKQKKDTQKQQLQLYDENDRLQKENKLLLQQKKTWESDSQALASMIAVLEEEKERIENERNGFQLATEEAERRVHELERDVEMAEEKLQVALDTDSQWEDELTKLQLEHQSETENLIQEIEKLRRQNHAIEKENVVLKDSTLVGEKQREIDILKKKLKETTGLVDELSSQLEAANIEKKQLADRLITYDETFDERFAERMSKEKENSRVLQKKLETMIARQHEGENLLSQAEARIAELTREVDTLRNWKVVYENGHGLQELAKHQKKMKEDKRRIELTLETVSTKLSETIEAKALVEQAFMKLKEETGRDIDFEYPQWVLERDMKSENGKLRAQVVELEEQIDALESDCVKLRRALKNQAGVIGEQGFKYAGMSPEMLVKVNEFATNLREGKLELPLDDRSAMLLKENKKLREDIKVLTLKNERYEIELSGGGGAQISQQLVEMMAQATSSKHSEEEFAALRSDLQNLLRVNDGLQSSLMRMQNEVITLLKQQKGSVSGTENIEAMLLASNEVLMKEIQDIRQSNAGATAPGKPIHDLHKDEDSMSGQSVSVHSIPDGKPPLANKSKPPQSTKLRLDTPELTPRGKPPQSGGLQYVTPLGRSSHHGLFTPGAHSPGFVSLNPPTTPHGKNLLQKTLANMNLPPEDWVDEMKDLNGQLIECLEQLFERESELQQQRGIIENLESYLVDMKQQMTTLYVDYAKKADEWDDKEKGLKKEMNSLAAERDDLQLQLRRVEETLDVLNAIENNSEQNIVQKLENKLKQYTRKLTVFEVNQAILTRKYHTLSEQFANEHQIRKQIETDFIEMEGVLKRRILFLEQYKLQIKTKVEQYQRELELSVPQSDYLVIQNELERLREDYLYSLRRELEAKISSLNNLEKEREVRVLKSKVIHLEAELVHAKQAWHNIAGELESQKELTQRTIQSFTNPLPSSAAATSHHQISAKDYGVIVSEMARYRGDASRLEVELITSNQRCDLLEIRIRELSNEMDASLHRIHELEERNEETEKSERAARKETSDLKIKYEGAILAVDATTLKEELRSSQKKITELEASISQFKEIAEIATHQAQSMSDFRDNYEDELKMLREHNIAQESRTDDDLIIGRLQRQLMATKTAYKAFTRKYQTLRSNMRQREITQRLLEHRLDTREETLYHMQENHKIELSALKKTLKDIYESLITTASGQANTSKRSKSSGEVTGRSSSNEEKASTTRQSKQLSNVSLEEQSLKSILYRLTGIGSMSGNQITISDKLSTLSVQMTQLTELAENSNDRIEVVEETNMKLELENDKLKEENKILLKSIADLREILDTQSSDFTSTGTGTNAVNNKKQLQLKQQTKAIALKVFNLNDEVKGLKVLNVQQKREIAMLQHEKKYLKNVLTRLESDLHGLEDGKLQLQSRLPIDLTGYDQDDPLIADFIKLRDDLFSYPADEESASPSQSLASAEKLPSKKVSPLRTGIGLTVETSMNDGTEPLRHRDSHENEDITKEELLDKMEKTTADMLAAKKDFHSQKRQLDTLHNKIQELQEVITDQEECIAYYERMASSEGLPTIRGRVPGQPIADAARSSSVPRGKEWRMMKEEQEKLQEAASATIGSMRSLLEEKNLEIERLQSKINSLIEGGNVQASGNLRKPLMSVADRRAEDLLRRLEDEERYRSNRRSSDDPRNTAEKSLVQRLMDQIDNADEILQEKIRTINQYEQKLAILINQKEKAEQRCGVTLDEMEAMKADMMTLVKQLQDSDERYRQIAKYQEMMQNEMSGKARSAIPEIPLDPDMTPLIKIRELKRKNLELHKMVSARDEKVKQYRTIIVSLKEEFLKSEEEKALLGVNAKAAAEAKPLIDSSEMEQLRSQISALRDGLRQAKEDLDAARKGRDKLVKARQAAQEETEKLESQVARAEAQASAAQEALARTRRDLEESKRREVRLRTKIKEIGENPAAEDGPNVNLLQEGIERLQRELEITKAENYSLKKALGGGSHATRGIPLDQVDDEEEEHNLKAGGGRILGGGPIMPGSVEEMRHQLHAKWESEKKLQKRISTLEKRLQEKIQEFDDSQAQLRKQKEMTQQYQTTAQREKDRADRLAKLANPSKPQGESVLEMHGRDELQSRIFELEEENDQYKKKVMVQFPNEIASLRHQNQTLIGRISELERELEDSEVRRKQLAASTREGAGGFGASLRASEDRYLREEVLRDELTTARRARLELEANALEKDSKIMEFRFELDAKDTEIARLKRRISELDVSSRGIGGAGGGALRSESPNVRGAGARFNKDRDTEAVVESLRKVVDKLKAENERLKRGVGTGEGKASETEKRLIAERKRTEKLEEDNKILSDKLKVLEDGGQKLVQRQQQIASLRKQLKSREDTITEQTATITQLQQDVATLQKSNNDLQSRIQQLELQVASRVANRPSSAPNPATLSELTDLRRKSAQQVVEMETLKNQLIELRRENVSLRTFNGGQGSGGVGGGVNSAVEVSSLKDQINKLTTENTKLKNELSAFDLDFFEEIENLKYSHAEAVRKLKAMEKMYGPMR